MKTSKKIIIAAVSVLLVAAIVFGAVYGAMLRKVPELDLNVKNESMFGRTYSYGVGTAPYIDSCVFETSVGLQMYWIENHKNGKGIEVVLQQTKDGELVVLSEDLPGRSNAAILYGEDVKVSGLTLEELQKIHLCYNFVDEDGVMSYKADPVEQLTVLSLSDFVNQLGVAMQTSALFFVRFKDESAITDMNKAMDQIRDIVVENLLSENVIFCTDSKDVAKYIDSSCEGLRRAATASEVKALYRASVWNKAQKDLPYIMVIADASSRYGSEKFIHYVRNLGLSVGMTGLTTENAEEYAVMGVNAIFADHISDYSDALDAAKKTVRQQQLNAKDAAAQ